jgi:pimeloyl-ACP methyl ester carboxylesterase
VNESPTVGASYAHVDGGRLAYSRLGDGPPVVFIQGVGVPGEAWRPQVAALSARYSCLWFDNRGVGKSLPAASRLSVDGMARDTAAILDAEECRDAHVIGHSLGGIVALRLALAAPSRVRSLSLLCTFARGRDAGASARIRRVRSRRAGAAAAA